MNFPKWDGTLAGRHKWEYVNRLDLLQEGATRIHRG
ncbi:hypothetical protein J3R75_003309 [Oligosphaera ethanolica]|jgi:hypothetical protein|uniref:Uncharacterized protein n=1 Tax=Oligosphaera ethanolica TaxID=760260 RepID=A0AAE3VI84_9BACT|nr:hypothetical protein [Oligosphaera ethanolica]